MSLAQTQDQPKPRLITVAEAQRRTSFSRSFIYKLMDTGQLAYCRIGRSRRIPADSLDALIAQNTVTQYA
jgi:excisionase family DNA binding protein